MNIRLWLLTGLVCTFGSLKAQNEIDILRYSQTSFGSTPRSLSMGGAFGAVGADLSSSSINPAGLAFYRTSQFSGALGFFNNNTRTQFIGTASEEQKTNLNIPSIGVVFSNINTRKGKEVQSGFINYNLGLVVNRVNNFNNKYYFEGINSDNSILDNFAQNAQGTPFSELSDISLPGLAWSLFLIDTFGGSDRDYLTALFNDSSFNLLQTNLSNYRGRMHDFNISFAGNYNHLLYLGASLTFTSVRFEDRTVFTETDFNNSVNDYHSTTMERNITTRGSGVSGRLGLILRPADFFRAGVSIQTPTFFSLNDVYSYNMTGNYDDGTSLSQNSPQGFFEYNITTPLRTNLSAALLFGKYGLVSVDYEMVDYAQGSLSATGFSFSDANRNTRDIYRNTSNLRLGTEWRYNQFAFRAGYANYGSPFKTSIYNAEDGKRESYTGGIGYREGNYFFDLAVVNTISSEYYTPYTLQNQATPSSFNESNTTHVVMGMGVKF